MVFLDCNWYQSVRLDPSFLALTERRAEKEMPGVSQVNPSGWIFTVFLSFFSFPICLSDSYYRSTCV